MYYPRIRLERLKNTTKFHKLAGLVPIFGPGTCSVQVSNFTVGAYFLGLSSIELHSTIRVKTHKTHRNTSQHIETHHITTHHNTSKHITTRRNTSRHIATHRNTSQLMATHRNAH